MTSNVMQSGKKKQPSAILNLDLILTRENADKCV